LTNFSNGKQTQESLESGFPEITFRKKNTAKRENTFLKTKPNSKSVFVDWKVFSVDRKVFSLTGKCFPLTNFPNGKQTQESLESGFPENEFQETSMALEKHYVVDLSHDSATNVIIDDFISSKKN
jgi:hypothetical protein